MMYAEKGNKVIRIMEGDEQRFLSQGYTIKNANGDVVAETIPTDVQALRLAYTQNKEKIAELEAEIATLKAELSKATPKKAPKAKAVNEEKSEE